jgi:IS30 family transposase
MRNIKKRKSELQKSERLEIGILYKKGYSMRAIAEVLGRSPNTISYEIKKNSVNGIYDPIKADTKARNKKKKRRFNYKLIEKYPETKKFVIEKLKEYWNPDEIAGYIKLKKPKGVHYVSKSAIYLWLRTARGERYCKYLYSKRRRIKRQKKKTKRVMIVNRVGIELRSTGANNRTRFGHWEVDTVLSSRGTKGGVSTILERKSRFYVVHKVSSMSSNEHLNVHRNMIKDKKVLSVTYDNGIENRRHADLGVSTFFCEPYSPWQKGSNENANKMLRRYFPKGTDFNKISQREIDKKVLLINKKPRRVLGYMSALEVALKAGIIRSIDSEVS